MFMLDTAVVVAAVAVPVQLVLVLWQEPAVLLRVVP